MGVYIEMMAADLNPGENVQPAVSLSAVRGAVGPAPGTMTSSETRRR